MKNFTLIYKVALVASLTLGVFDPTFLVFGYLIILLQSILTLIQFSANYFDKKIDQNQIITLSVHLGLMILTHILNFTHQSALLYVMIALSVFNIFIKNIHFTFNRFNYEFLFVLSMLFSVPPSVNKELQKVHFDLIMFALIIGYIFYKLYRYFNFKKALWMLIPIITVFALSYLIQFNINDSQSIMGSVAVHFVAFYNVYFIHKLNTR